MRASCLNDDLPDGNGSGLVSARRGRALLRRRHLDISFPPPFPCCRAVGDWQREPCSQASPWVAADETIPSGLVSCGGGDPRYPPAVAPWGLGRVPLQGTHAGGRSRSAGNRVALDDFGVGVFSYVRSVRPHASTSVAGTGWDSEAAGSEKRVSRFMRSIGTGQGGRSWRG